jgi:hypothetical protein
LAPAAQVTARYDGNGGYVEHVGERLRTTAAQHPGRALGVLAAVAVLGSALAAGWTDRLALSTTESKGTPLQIQVRGPLPAGSPTFRVAVRTMRAQLSSDPVVAAVREQARKPSSNSTLLLVRFDVKGQRRDAAIERIQSNLDPGPLTLAFKGPAMAVRIAKDDAVDHLFLLLIALPFVALIAAWPLGVRPAGAALLAAAASSALAAIACELLGGTIDVSWLALVGAAAGGILLTLQLCAMARAGAGPAALWGSGLAAAATFGAVAILGVGYLASLGLGGGLGSLLAVPAAQGAMGAMGTLEPSEGAGGSGPWRGIGGLVGWSRVIGALIAILAFVVLAIVAVPAQRLATAAIGAVLAPAISRPELGGAIAAAVVITVALGWTIGRRAGLAILAAVAAAIPAFGAVGLLVVTFQEGRLEGFLDYTSSGALQLGSIGAAASVVAALCAAQAVALAWAARQVEQGVSGVDRVREAMARCGPPATAACLAGATAGIALGFASPSFIKEFGLGIAAGLVLELLIVQALIAPALLSLTAGRTRDQ